MFNKSPLNKMLFNKSYAYVTLMDISGNFIATSSVDMASMLSIKLISNYDTSSYVDTIMSIINSIILDVIITSSVDASIIGTVSITLPSDVTTTYDTTTSLKNNQTLTVDTLTSYDIIVSNNISVALNAQLTSYITFNNSLQILLDALIKSTSEFSEYSHLNRPVSATFITSSDALFEIFKMNNIDMSVNGVTNSVDNSILYNFDTDTSILVDSKFVRDANLESIFTIEFSKNGIFNIDIHELGKFNSDLNKSGSFILIENMKGVLTNAND